MSDYRNTCAEFAVIFMMKRMVMRRPALPGTRWEDVPDDWRCPECAQKKANIHCWTNPFFTGSMHIIIIGSGVAGVSFAEKYRSLLTDDEITLITEKMMVITRGLCFPWL